MTYYGSRANSYRAIRRAAILPLCVMATTLSAFAAPSHVVAQESKSKSSDAAHKAALARTILAQIEKAQENLKSKTGIDILGSPSPLEIKRALGQENLADVWNRELIAAGMPPALDEREEVARSLDLDPQASLVLMGVARRDGIEYLIDKLNAIANFR